MVRLLVFISGMIDEDGAIIKALLRFAHMHRELIEIAAVVCDQGRGEVARCVEELNSENIHVRFFGLNGTRDKNSEKKLLEATHPDFVLLIGWPYQVFGLDPGVTFTLDLYDREIYKGCRLRDIPKMILAAFHGKRIKESAVTMSFIQGPVFFRHPFSLDSEMNNPEDLLEKAKEIAIKSFPAMMLEVLSLEISWDGKNPSTLQGAHLHRYREK